MNDLQCRYKTVSHLFMHHLWWLSIVDNGWTKSTICDCVYLIIDPPSLSASNPLDSHVKRSHNIHSHSLDKQNKFD